MTITETPEDCAHLWVPNSGLGGPPVFLNQQMSNAPIMHAKCYFCGCRTWLTREQWNQADQSNEEKP